MISINLDLMSKNEYPAYAKAINPFGYGSQAQVSLIERRGGNERRCDFKSWSLE